MAVAGRVAIVPKGDWSSDTLYEKLDAVYYLGSSYVAKKSSVNILPTDTEYWMLMVTGTSDEQINQLIEDINALSDEVDAVKEDIANLDAEVEATKKSVSDGKTLVANAITEKGVETATDATFAEMAENIMLIETGGGELHGASILVTTGENENYVGLDCELYFGDELVATQTVSDTYSVTFTDIQYVGTYIVKITYAEVEHSQSAEITADDIVNCLIIEVPIDFKLYLYNEGDECVGVTGGAVFEDVLGTNANIQKVNWTKNTSNIYGYTVQNYSYGALGCFYFKNPLPFDQYTKLCIEATSTATTTGQYGSGDIWIRFYNTVTNIDSVTPTSDLSITQGTTSRQVITIDLSSIETDDYLAICFASAAQGAMNGYVYKVWLE